MASTLNVFLCAGLAILVYACIGLPLAARVAARPLALMLAPALGWAAHSAAALPLFYVIGLSRVSVVVVFAVAVVAAVTALWMGRAAGGEERALTRTTAIALIGAALLALAVAAAILPKISADGVVLAAPAFDHSKVAMIDEMARLGVPPGNPFYGGAEGPARLVYYYLWHFSAAELSLLAQVSGWEADAALTWFTAFASLAAMIGLAVWLSGRGAAALWVVALAATESLAAAARRPVRRRSSAARHRRALRLRRLAVPDQLGAAAHGVGNVGGDCDVAAVAPCRAAQPDDAADAGADHDGRLRELDLGRRRRLAARRRADRVADGDARAPARAPLDRAASCRRGADRARADFALSARPVPDGGGAWRRARHRALSGARSDRRQPARAARQPAGLLADFPGGGISRLLPRRHRLAGRAAEGARAARTRQRHASLRRAADREPRRRLAARQHARL